jgi:hypothetical protein
MVVETCQPLYLSLLVGAESIWLYGTSSLDPLSFMFMQQKVSSKTNSKGEH